MRLYIQEGEQRDFLPLMCGREVCKPCHTSNGVRNYYMIHYVESGHGTLTLGNVRYELGAGQIFLIGPGEKNEYMADREEPWTYSWLNFSGKMMRDFDEFPRVCEYPFDTFRRLNAMLHNHRKPALLACGALYEIAANLQSGLKPAPRRDYAARAREMVDSYYMTPINVGQIADSLSIDRRYLPRLFREKYGESVEQYLIRVRMEHAAAYIAEGRTAGEAGRLCGYEDPVNFYRMFKRHFGIGPAAYRRGQKCRDER